MTNSEKMIFILSLAALMPVAGCGGSNDSPSVAPPAMATIGGTVTGLPSVGSVFLVDNSSDTILASNNGSFTFDTKIQAGSSYNVTALEPAGIVCTVTGGVGTIDQNADSIANISVSCQQGGIAMAYSFVTVTVSGLASGSSVTFLDNGSDPLTANANGLFVFSDTISSLGEPVNVPLGTYNVTVSTNPTGQVCTLTNATGTVSPSTSFVNATATCH
ncbi:MAG: hypothetical protein ACHP7O_02905 [Burkholderiales bacterium]